jgi:hypothetical protein
MLRRFFLLWLLMVVLSTSQAQEICRSGRPVETPWGGLVMNRCVDSQRYPLKSFVSIGGKKVLEDKALFEEESNKGRSIWIYTGKALAETGCADRLYLIDLSKKPMVVLAFGVKRTCNVFHWASWSDKRSVIALKNNVKFTYENGKMTLPANGEKLWKAIEPPHAGAGLNLEDALAFSEDVPLPK